MSLGVLVYISLPGSLGQCSWVPCSGTVYRARTCYEPGRLSTWHRYSYRSGVPCSCTGCVPYEAEDWVCEPCKQEGSRQITGLLYLNMWILYIIVAVSNQSVTVHSQPHTSFKNCRQAEMEFRAKMLQEYGAFFRIKTWCQES